MNTSQNDSIWDVPYWAAQKQQLSHQATRVCLKTRYLKQAGFSTVEEWLASPRNVYVGRKKTVRIARPALASSPNTKVVQRFQIEPSNWANDYLLKNCTSPTESIAAFVDYFRSDPSFPQLAVAQLSGKVLGCWCTPDELCHADWLVDYVNEAKDDQHN